MSRDKQTNVRLQRKKGFFRRQQIRILQVFILFRYLIGVLYRTQKYFTHTTWAMQHDMVWKITRNSVNTNPVIHTLGLVT